MKYRKIIIQFVMIPLGIAFLSFLLYATSIYLSDGRFFSIVKPIHKNLVDQETPSIIIGEIPYDFGRIGTVIVHFDQPDSSKGSIIFTVSEKTRKRIIYQNKYSLHDIYYKNSFPFGFPPIEQSSKEQYQFEVTASENIQIPALSENPYPYEILYQFDRSYLANNPQMTQFFLKKKVEQYGFHMLHSRNTLFYFSPVILYYIGVFLHKRYKTFFKKNFKFLKTFRLEYPSLIILITILFLSSILFTEQQSGFIATFGLLWVFLSGQYRLQAESHFFLALVFLLLCPLLLISDMSGAASTIASWSFIFIFIGSLKGIRLLESPYLRIPYARSFDSVLKKYYRILLRYIS